MYLYNIKSDLFLHFNRPFLLLYGFLNHTCYRLPYCWFSWRILPFLQCRQPSLQNQ